MRATFRPVNDGFIFTSSAEAIEILVIDESGDGVEIRVRTDGTVRSFPLTFGQGINFYRSSVFWEEVE